MSAADIIARGIAAQANGRTAGYRAIGDGIGASESNLVSAAGDPGVLSGTYYYSCTFVTALGETAPWPGTAVPVTVAARRINLSGIPIGPSGVIARRIYRTKAASPDPKDYYLVATIADNVTTGFVDNVADAALGPPVSWASSNRGVIQAAGGDPVLRFSDTSTSYGLRNGGAKGYANVAVGNNAMEKTTSGRRNIGVGVYALQNLTIGQCNTAMGTHAGNGLIDSEHNAFYGYAAGGLTAAPRNFNVALGSQAFTGGGTQTGAGNVAIGYRALFAINSADQVIGIGFFAGQYANASRQLFIDNVSRPNIGAAQDQGLVYGKGEGTPQTQELRLNARVRLGWDPALALVVNLPAAGAALRGFRAYVTDASVAYAAASIGAAVAGGGTNTVPVFCNGTAWVIG